MILYSHTQQKQGSWVGLVFVLKRKSIAYLKETDTEGNQKLSLGHNEKDV